MKSIKYKYVMKPKLLSKCFSDNIMIKNYYK